MDRDTAVGLVRKRLGNLQGTFLDADIITEMQLQQDTLERGPTLPWFLLSQRNDTYTTVGEERIALPVDFLREYEDGCLFYFNESYNPAVDSSDGPWRGLEKDSWDALKLAYQVRTGPPEKYALSDGYFRIFPLPDEAYLLRMIYYQKGSSLSTNVTDNVWLTFAPDLLIAQTAQVIANLYLQNAALAERLKAEVMEAKGNLLRNIVAREMANLESTMGD